MNVSWTSHTADLDGDVHYIDFGGPTEVPAPVAGDTTPRTIVLVHGLGGSHLNWIQLGPMLANRARVYALDLPGFGLSHPAGRSGSVTANARVLDRFLRAVAPGPAILVGNSMGGMISMIQAHEHPETVAGLALLDPVLPRAKGAPFDREITAQFARYAIPGIGERFLARRRANTPPRQSIAESFEQCCVDPSRVPADVFDASAALVEARQDTPGIDHAFLQASRSLLRFGARGGRFQAMMRALPMPVLLLHGEKDRLVPVENARAAATTCPHWTFETLPGVGHIPMMEVPEMVADRITSWLASNDRSVVA
jgi:pimeloyl-ACP methyl ester carboxylesterase